LSDTVTYAKKLLEEAGFVVEIGEYRYSEEYPEGYVIAQSPEGSVTAKSGTVVTLDISSGLIEPETEPVQTEPATEAPTDAPTQAPVEKQTIPLFFLQAQQHILVSQMLRISVRMN